MAKKVNIKGPVVGSSDQWIYDYFEIEAVSPKTVNKAIEEANGEELVVEINSGGGDVFAGSEIYTALKSYQGNVKVSIVGIAASAASVIAMAGNKISMSPTAQMMIHNVTSYGEGDYRDMDHKSEILKNANETIANAYRIKSGMEQEDLLKMMDKETWLTAEKAKDCGLIDEVMFENEIKLVAGLNHLGMLPQEVIEKTRNEFKQKQLTNAKLKLLKLKKGSV